MGFASLNRMFGKGECMNVRTKDEIIRIILLSAASVSILIVILIFIFLGKEGVPFFYQRSLADLFGLDWNPAVLDGQTPSFGIIQLLTGSLVVTFVAALFSVPIGITASVYISEVAHKIEREILKPLIEILATIPSVVFGFFALVVLSPIIRSVFHLSTGMTAFTGSIILTLMALPTIISISEDAIRSVPQSYRQASLALGATELQTTWKVVVPSAMSGIVAAVTLGIGRVIGETMAVLMVTGNSTITTINPFDSVRTMTATVAAEMGEVAYGDIHYNALFVVGIVLLLFTFGLNLIAQRFLRLKERA